MRVEKSKELRKETFESWMIIAAVAIMVGVCCALCPWLADDLIYQYNCRWFEESSFVPVRTIGDLFESQYYHYFYTNGRYVAHWIVQLFDGILGQNLFAIANGIVYLLFIRMIMATSGIRMTNRKGVLTTACLVITCQCLRMSPAFQMYIWMYLLVLCYLWILMHYHTRKWWMIALLCVFSLICGNAHESLNPGVCVGVAIYFTLNHRKISRQPWLMLIFFCLGLLILLASPATLRRIDYTEAGSKLEWRILSLYSLKNAIPAFYILMAVTLYKVIFQRVSFKKIILSDVMWWSIWGTNFALILLLGFGGGRAVLGEELGAVILTLKILKRKSFTPFWLTLLCAATIGLLYVQIHKIIEVRHYIVEIERQAKESTDGNIYIDFTYTPSVAGLEQYTSLIRNVNILAEKDEERMMALISHNFTEKWGVDKELRFYPTALRPYIEGKADTTDGNIIARINSDSYLIVQNKKHPAKFHVTYHRDILFFDKDFPWEDIPYVRAGVYESDQWRANIFYSSFYHKYYPATFSMSKPDSARSGAN